MTNRSAPEALRVRVYNVRFGDAILVSVPEDDRTRHILIDVGNVQSGAAGSTDVFAPVMADIQKQLDGEPLDLYVMTHEHMDHVKGLTYAADKLGVNLRARYAWLTASSALDYGDHFPNAVKQRKLAELAVDAARASLAAAPDERLEPLLLNNDFRATSKCVNHLRDVAETTTYVHREAQLDGTHPFREAGLQVWAPEADASLYYGRFTPAAFSGATAQREEDDTGEVAAATATRPLAPGGVDMTAFHDLLDWRSRGHADNLFMIDRAANNTSIVFSIEWRGWTLLFAGDAEIRSWKTMAKYGMLRPVHLLKVAHHGSSNGTPDPDLLDMIFPAQRADERERYAVVSTCLDTYSGVPDDPTLAALRDRGITMRSTLDLTGDELFFNIDLEGAPPASATKATDSGLTSGRLPHR